MKRDERYTKLNLIIYNDREIIYKIDLRLKIIISHLKKKDYKVYKLKNRPPTNYGIYTKKQLIGLFLFDLSIKNIIVFLIYVIFYILRRNNLILIMNLGMKFNF